MLANGYASHRPSRADLCTVMDFAAVYNGRACNLAITMVRGMPCRVVGEAQLSRTSVFVPLVISHSSHPGGHFPTPNTGPFLFFSPLWWQVPGACCRQMVLSSPSPNLFPFIIVVWICLSELRTKPPQAGGHLVFYCRRLDRECRQTVA